MTIQVGHSLGCPTFFFCVPPLWGGEEVNESTSQQVNGSTGQQDSKLVSDRSDKSDLSDAPFFIFRQKFVPFAAYINHNIS